MHRLAFLKSLLLSAVAWLLPSRRKERFTVETVLIGPELLALRTYDWDDTKGAALARAIIQKRQLHKLKVRIVDTQDDTFSDIEGTMFTPQSEDLHRSLMQEAAANLIARKLAA